jgi:hypothetical protein
MVTYEQLDDDVIAIHLETGMYYAFDGVAADCWSGVAAHASVDDIAAALGARFGVSTDRALDDVAAFVTGLVGERLVVDDPEPPGLDAPAWATTYAQRQRPGAYAPPLVQRYDDLDDLLMLDPIHEVDDAGWPVARGD